LFPLLGYNLRSIQSLTQTDQQTAYQQAVDCELALKILSEAALPTKTSFLALLRQST